MSSSNATPIESNSSNHEKDETHVNDSESSSHLVQHSSKSSLFFYYFSFCPPFPPLGKPREVLQHPLTLYFLGIICAVLAGLAFPALDLLYGIWTNGEFYDAFLGRRFLGERRGAGDRCGVRDKMIK